MQAMNILTNYAPAEPRIFKIPEANMGAFETRLLKLVRKAHKIGCETPTFSVVGESTEVRQVIADRVEDQFGREKIIYTDKIYVFKHIVLNNPEVKVAGYDFVATIEHTAEGNIIHSRVGADRLPLEYRECKSGCDHCNTIRRRTETFIVKHETGTYKQIGRNCLSLYFGIDGERYASMAEIYFELNELAEASEGGDSWGGSGPSYDYLDSYLAFVSECITRYAWRSRTTAREFGGSSTADKAMKYMHPSKEDIRENRLEWRHPSVESIDTAKLAIAWCEALTDAQVEDSDYLHNIRLIAKRGIVSYKQLGFAASIVSAYLKEQGNLKRNAKLADQALVSKYVGEIDMRRVFKLNVEKIIGLFSETWGSSKLYLMSDAEGNRFTCKSNSLSLKEDTTVWVKATVKKHEEYEGVKQTQLSRMEQVQVHTFTCVIAGATYSGEEVDEKSFRKSLCEALNMARWPRGIVVTKSEVAS